jgi:uncharacterized protein YecE (DUF72 family)
MDSRPLEQKISGALFQRPPNFLEDAQRLASFLVMLPRRYRYAFEFRHRSWYVDRALTILQEADVALCFSDHPDAPAPWETTAGHIYVRGNGPSGRYHGTYPARRDECCRKSGGGAARSGSPHDQGPGWTGRPQQRQAARMLSR